MSDAPLINDPDLWLARFPWPTEDGHKHDRGRLYVVSGGVSSTGAARMAGRAGLRIGAGLVTVLSPPAALTVNASQLEAVMVRSFDGPDGLVRAADLASAVVIGPAAGVGEGTQLNVLALARTEATLVLDADALTSFRHDSVRLFGALSLGAPTGKAVMTPHEGEFERLFPGLLKAEGRLAAARKAAATAHAVVLLKGAETVIAHPDGRAILNRHASPFLATAGSGDVLAGLIGGLIAQGMEPFDAAPTAAWLHGEAARRFGPGLIAEDLPDLMPQVLRDLHDRSGTVAAPPR